MTAESVETTFDHLDRLAVPAQPAPAPSPAEGQLLLVSTSAGSFYDRAVKRVLDVFVSALLLVLFAPLLSCIAVATALSLGRPVLFRQQRVGRGGQHFTVLKFRTMLQDRRETEARASWDGTCRRRTHKSEVDPRHTRFGRMLRRTSLDELPQLWNVLMGDMSLVGPRPELVSVVEHYAGWQHRRHTVRPGLTGLWQISARGATPMHEATHIDLTYVRDLSLATDLRILLGTPIALLRRGGS